MIVGTAGHIDHGKTTLVRALTGVDTDRLPEEKRRGISIELGYAFLDAPGTGERIGFIDVPGHERLVHTMIAGATGIDFALLLVAADDGVMPQTREHLAVLSLLGLARGAAVVTKADRAEPARVQQVLQDTAALLQGTALAGAPVLPVSATTGDGLAALRALLFEAAAAPPPHAGEGAFRLAVDRVFTLPGTGTVATGTVHAGSVAIGDELVTVPSGVPVRVRSLHAQNRAVSSATAGMRCALALAGIEKHQLDRGAWVVAPAAALATDRLDAQLTLWAGEAAPLRSGTPVHVHIGACTTTGSVAVLDGPALHPGESARVQLVLRERVGAWHGEPVVLRDAAASRTLAGGRVLDPFGPARYRRTAQRSSELDALALPHPAQRLQALLAASPQGVDLLRHRAAQGGLPLGDVAAIDPGALRQTDTHADWALAATHAGGMRNRMAIALAKFHADRPEEPGPDAARLRRLAAPRLPEPLWRALLAQARADGAVVQRGAFVHLPEHAVRLSATEERIAQKAGPLLAAAGFEGAWVRDLARDTGEPEALLRVALTRLAQRGELHQVVKDLYLPPATVARLATIARQLAAEHAGEVTAARFRDATQLGRKRAIQLLEHLDQIGLLRRVGDTHRLRADSALFSEAAE